MSGSRAFRTLAKVINANKQLEGGGFVVARALGGPKLPNFDPFLLLDHLGPTHYKPGEAVGAPWHPHRGFETVTYLLQGEMQHRDSMGNKGSLRAGDVQWMTAGSGVIHDEEPSDGMKQKGGTMEGFQLWVNLPAKDKMCNPAYQDVSKERIPEHRSEQFFVRVIAGEAFGTKAVVNTHVPIQYLDFHAEKGAEFVHSVPSDMRVCVYVYRGSALFGSQQSRVAEGQLATFDDAADAAASDIKVTVDGEGGAKFLLLAGRPIGEPVAWRGPFVMNTQQEIMQAMMDYQQGKLVRHTAKMESQTSHAEEFDPSKATIV